MKREPATFVDFLVTLIVIATVVVAHLRIGDLKGRVAALEAAQARASSVVHPLAIHPQDRMHWPVADAEGR